MNIQNYTYLTDEVSVRLSPGFKAIDINLFLSTEIQESLERNDFDWITHQIEELSKFLVRKISIKNDKSTGDNIFIPGDVLMPAFSEKEIIRLVNQIRDLRESFIYNKLIEMGWTPPASNDDLPAGKDE